MSKIINRLSELVSNQIAAGEVVQRPSSVVKELMENAIDAGSESVSVSVISGGKDEIQVYDEGCGIDYEDAVIAFERHATSKISDTDDIYNLNTFGFRGEALASIASVAEVEMRTRQESDELGTVVRIKGGKLMSCERDAVVRQGTQFIVRNLFFNVPARKRSLDKKSDNSELESVKTEFKKVALCYPRLSFLLLSNKKEVYNLPVTNLRRRVADVMGMKMVNNLMEIYVDTSMVEIKGYLGKPENAKRRPEQFMFVNNRYFRHPGLHKAVMDAYEHLLPSGDVQPPYFLYFTIDPSKIDVNIHPSKTEVHFEDEQDISQILLTGVKSCLGKNGIVPMIEFNSSDRIDMTPIVDGDDVSIDISSFGYQENDYNPFNESFSFSKALGRDSVYEIEEEPFKSVPSHYSTYNEKSKGFQHYFESFERDYQLESFESSDVPVELDSEFSLDGDDIVEIDSEHESDEKVIEIEPEPFFSGMGDVAAVLKDVFIFDDKYIVALMASRMLLINIRRAMSRILFDRYSKSISEKQLPGQKLLFPVDVSFSVPDRMLVEQCMDDLRGMGFEFTNSPVEGALQVVAVPVDFRNDNINGFFENFLDALKADTMGDYRNNNREALIISLVNSATNYRYSLKSKDEMKYVVTELLACENYSYTPNGKRIILDVTSEDITKMLL